MKFRDYIEEDIYLLEIYKRITNCEISESKYSSKFCKDEVKRLKLSANHIDWIWEQILPLLIYVDDKIDVKAPKLDVKSETFIKNYSAFIISVFTGCEIFYKNFKDNEDYYVGDITYIKRYNILAKELNILLGVYKDIFKNRCTTSLNYDSDLLNKIIKENKKLKFLNENLNLSDIEII